MAELITFVYLPLLFQPLFSDLKPEVPELVWEIHPSHSRLNQLEFLDLSEFSFENIRDKISEAIADSTVYIGPHASQYQRTVKLAELENSLSITHPSLRIQFIRSIVGKIEDGRLNKKLLITCFTKQADEGYDYSVIELNPEWNWLDGYKIRMQGFSYEWLYLIPLSEVQAKAKEEV